MRSDIYFNPEQNLTCMQENRCLTGVKFRLIGEVLYFDQQPTIEILFDNPADESLILSYEWYLNDDLVVNIQEKVFAENIPYGAYKIAARVLIAEGWSGLIYHSLFYNPIPVLSIEGPLKILEGSTAAFDVIATLYNGENITVTDMFTFESTEGVFLGNNLTVPVNENHSDQRIANITATGNIGSAGKQITILNSTPVILLDTRITGDAFIGEGESKNYQVIQYFSDGSSKDVTMQYRFKTSEGQFDGSLLTIPLNQNYEDSRQVTITAQKGKTLLPLAVQVLDTTPVVLKKIEIYGSSIIEEGETNTYQIIETYSDDSVQDKTSDYSFQSDEGTFENNLLTVSSNGSFNDTRHTLIVATHNGDLQIVKKNITIIDTTPVMNMLYELTGPATLAEGNSANFQTFGIYPDGSKINLTSKYTFTSSEGFFSGGRLTIAENSIIGDNRQIVITAKRTGFDDIAKQIQIGDTTTEDSLVLVSVTITGPDQVAEGSNNNLYSLIANYENNISYDKTSQAVFTLDANDRGIFNGNNLSVFSNPIFDDNTSTNVIGSYKGMTSQYGIEILDKTVPFSYETSWNFTEFGAKNNWDGSSRNYISNNIPDGALWSLTPNNLGLRITYEASLNCGGTNNFVQGGTALVTISITKAAKLIVSWSGMGEVKSTGYERAMLYVNDVLIGNASSPGGGDGCGVAPVISQNNYPNGYLLSAGSHILKIECTTQDALYNTGAFYEFSIQLLEVEEINET